MKAVSNEFKAAAIAPVKVVGGSVSLLDGSASYTENDFLQSITLESTGEMFGAVATIATFKLKGDNYNLEEKEVYIKYSLQTENGFENIDYGIYKIAKQSVSKNKESTEFVAHSKMLQMQEGNYAELEGFPMTVAQTVSEIASRESFTVSDMSDLPNADYTIQEDLYKNINGANYRSIFAEVAGATGTMAVFNNINNNLFFREYQSTVQQSLDYSYLKKYQIGEHYGAINTLVLARTPQEDNIVVKDEEMVDEDGPKEVKLANNEILDDDRETLITPIFNAIKGMEWTGFEIETVGLGWLECGDRIEITDDQNNTIEGIVTYLKITIDGGIKETIKGIPPIKTETNYAIAGGVMKTIYNTEIKVDKQNQEIQSIVSEQTQFENQTTENFTNITQNISSVVTSVQGSGGNNLIKNSSFFASDDSGRFFDWEMGTESTILPPEYQQVEYIESTGTQYIDTEYSPNNNSGIEVALSGIPNTNDSNFLGCRTASTRWAINVTGEYLGCCFGSYDVTSISSYPLEEVKNIKMNFLNDKKFVSSNSSLVFNITSTISGPMPNAYLFAQNDSRYNYGQYEYKIHSAKISDENNVVRNFVPCYQIADKKPGLYDTINNIFYTNQGTGEFIAGQAVGIPIVYPSAEVAAHGSLSGQVISLAGVLISQAVLVKADDSSITEENKTYYSFSCRCKKNLAGTASITITDGTEEGVWTIDFPNGTDADWEEFNIDKILPQSSELRITATGSSDSDFQITDMMLAVGDYHSQWQQASGESNNTQVSITTDGITVKNGNLATFWSRHNNQGFNAYKDRQLTASLNADEVIAPKAEFSKEIDMPPIKIVPQSDGWAFVSTIS